MLKRAHITGYKSLVDAEITFADPLTLIIGPNASGKTNLFDALALLSRIVAKGSVEEAFKAHRGTYLKAFSFDAAGLPASFVQPEREMRFEIDVELSSTTIEDVSKTLRLLDPTGNALGMPQIAGTLLRYSIHIQTQNQGKRPSIVQEQLFEVQANGIAQEEIAPFIDRRSGIPFSLSERDYYTSIIEGDKLGSDVPYAAILRLPYVIAFRSELSRWHFYALSPEQTQQQSDLNETRVLPSNGNNLAAFFDTLNTYQPKKMKQIEQQLNMIIPQIDSMRIESPKAGEFDLVVHENGIDFSSRVISEGTLRVLGLLALSNPIDPVSLIGVEEPEMGIHPHRLAYIARHFRNLAEWRGKQIQYLLTSHSPLMPEYFAPEQVVVCRRQHNQTQFVPLREAGIFPLPQDEPFDPDAEEPTPLRDRIVRGDYGG